MIILIGVAVFFIACIVLGFLSHKSLEEHEKREENKIIDAMKKEGYSNFEIMKELEEHRYKRESLKNQQRINKNIRELK